MGKLTDEEIQKMLDGHFLVPENEDTDMYIRLYRTLNAPANIAINHLTEEVLDRIEEKQEFKSSVKTTILCGSIIFTGVIFFICACISFNSLVFKVLDSSFLTLRRFLLLFAVGLVVFFIDKLFKRYFASMRLRRL
ncbi:hypothetical protein [Mucilaginibacter jinjuensis]|uniref:DUF1700 domain-containing protein n=1 Tax=Mucilaginibacter jinjuensis TaxID=1176721 RepID=A0ABY7TDT1_9SPHI|nr:hypothetical protein [Mucilaginibacter jinjuensis]WCT14353.1 hypothetical protein PQO05_10455 [Mucilaginibacter jinjuensis]